ncbi:MAG: DUF4352 domain-containing protein [Actinomycetia bacterium]|nr:DUF4352 domain-containing protein [Actinomycetes bacterium]
MTDQPPHAPGRPDPRAAAAERLAEGRARDRALLEDALANQANDGVDWETVGPGGDVDLGAGGLTRWIGPALTLVAVLVIGGLIWAFVGRGSGDSDGPYAVAPAAGAETVTDTAPRPVNQPIQMGDWTVAVTSWDADASTEVQERNPNNRAPAAGETFALAGVELTRTGSQTADGFDLNFRLVDEAGVEYPDFDSQCGVVPNGLDKFIELEPGESTAGAVCFAIPVDQAGLVGLVIGPAVDLDGTAVVFDLP